MNLPPSLRIGYRDYKVETWPSKTAQTHGANGLCDPINAIIYVNEDRIGYDALDTLLHEILHACFHVADIDAEKDGEERIVTRLATMLVQTWRDNYDLRKFLNEVKPAG
jgi:Zn-dependent peptidase ImmA (M78 family)